MTVEPTARLAVLIDGDNVAPNSVAKLFAEIAKYGTASVRRIYGDWSNRNLNGWRDYLANTRSNRFSSSPTHGKNSTDIAMVIDAMDLLYTRSLLRLLHRFERWRLHAVGDADPGAGPPRVWGREAQDTRFLRQRLRKIYLSR